MSLWSGIPGGRHGRRGTSELTPFLISGRQKTELAGRAGMEA